jgi:hypothetical protein
MSYGELVGYPAGGLTPIPSRQGKESWEVALTHARPMWLGIAWERIEAKEATDKQGSVKGADYRPRKDKSMPVLQWKESTGSMVDPGMYRFEVTSLEDTEGKFGPQIQLQLAILDNDGDSTGQEIRMWCSAKWGNKTQMLEIAKVLLGKKCPVPPAPIDTDVFIGRKGDMEVVSYRKVDGTDGVKVGSLYPYRSVTKEEDDEQAFPAK